METQSPRFLLHTVLGNKRRVDSIHLFVGMLPWLRKQIKASLDLGIMIPSVPNFVRNNIILVRSDKDTTFFVFKMSPVSEAGHNSLSINLDSFDGLWDMQSDFPTGQVG